MKSQASFSSKDKSKKLKCRLLQFLFGTLRVKNSIEVVKVNICIYSKARKFPVAIQKVLWR